MTYISEVCTYGLQQLSNLCLQFLVYVMNLTTWWHTHTHTHKQSRKAHNPFNTQTNILMYKSHLLLVWSKQRLTVWHLVNTHRITFTQTHYFKTVIMWLHNIWRVSSLYLVSRLRLCHSPEGQQSGNGVKTDNKLIIY